MLDRHNMKSKPLILINSAEIWRRIPGSSINQVYETCRRVQPDALLGSRPLFKSGRFNEIASLIRTNSTAK